MSFELGGATVVPPFHRLAELDQLHSSYLILLTLVALGLAAGVLYYLGLLGRVIGVLGVVVRGAVRCGFHLWERLFAWAGWPVFLAVVVGLLSVGCLGGEALPGLAVLCGLVPLFMGVTACLAYMFIDLERYEVERGHKAVHNPMKGQEMARHLVRYGHQVGLPLLAAAAVGAIGGFALLNLGLYRGLGKEWYHPTEEPAYVDFLAYAFVNIYRIVDLLDLANSQHLLHMAVVKPAAWPASTLLTIFKTFFTLVLLQQLFASVRKGKLLAEMIADFWSPHEPIHVRARTALPQYGAIAIGPLLISLRSVTTLTKEQRDQLPLVLAMIGPATIPVLVRYLCDPHEHVRAVVVAALGHLRALDTVPLLASLGQDPSELVRLSVVEALGIIGGGNGQPVRKRRRPWSAGQGLGWLRWWRKRAVPLPPADPIEVEVATLRTALEDKSAAVRTQAALALARIGAPAAAVAPDLIGLLKDPDESVCCQAAEALGCVGAAEAITVNALVEVLQDASAAVKASAARALGALKKAASPAVSALVPLLQDREGAVRTAAAEAIAKAGPLDKQATDALVEGLASPDTVVQAHTAEALGAIGTAAQEAAPALVEVLGNGSDRVRGKAAQALGKIGEAAAEAAVPRLVRALRDQEHWVSALAAEALGEMGESADEAIPALVRSLRHSSPLVRGNAAEALGKMGAAAARARPALEKAARDEDGGVRSQAVRALGTVGRPTPTTEQAVLDGLRDADPLVRAGAVEAVGQWGAANEAALNGLMPLLEDANDQVKVQVTQVLPMLAGATSALIDGLCRRLLEDDSAWVQVNAALALGKLGPAAGAAGGPLLRAAQTGEESVREQAMRAIAMIQPPEIAKAFVAGLNDASAHIRKVASGGWIKAAAIPEEVIPALVEALRDPESQVRANAAHALGRLDALPAEAIPALIACTADANDGLRLNAAVALRRAPASAVGETMRQLVEDSNVRIRLVAAGALLTSDPSDARASAVLMEALGDVAPRVRKAALELVESLGPASAPLVETLQQRAGLEEDGELQAALGHLLERLALPVRMT
jgi:HEAT repeat protein